MDEHEERYPVTAMDMWNWPETRAFFKRIGLDMSLPTMRVIICLDFQKQTFGEVKHYYHVGAKLERE